MLKKITRSFSSISNYKLPSIEKVLIYNKLTAFEYHKHRYTTYFATTKVVDAHYEHQDSLATLKQALYDYGIQPCNIKTVQTRHQGYNLLYKNGQEDSIDKYHFPPKDFFQPDLIIAIGGDGTFLRASHLIHPKLKTLHVPIVGINSNPKFSEGRLMLKTPNPEDPIDVKLKKLFNSHKIEVTTRNRIQVTLTTKNRLNFVPKDFYDELPLNEIRTLNPKNIHDPDYFKRLNKRYARQGYKSAELPIVALNDVYVGERGASMVSNLEISFRSSETNEIIELAKQKSSGVVFCTGTGSTGWTNSINKITDSVTKSVLANIQAIRPNLTLNETEIQKITQRVNERRTVFDPETPAMGMTFREAINNSISSAIKSSNFVFTDEASVKSRLHHGLITIDGSTFHSFPSGSSINLEMNKKMAIKCITGFQ